MTHSRLMDEDSSTTVREYGVRILGCGPWVGTEHSDQSSSGKSDGEQAPLSHLVQLVKANRWVQLGHTLLLRHRAQGKSDRGRVGGELPLRQSRPVSEFRREGRRKSQVEVVGRRGHVALSNPQLRRVSSGLDRGIMMV